MNPMMRVISAAALGLVVAGGIFLWFYGNEPLMALQPDNESVVALGGSLYKTHCAECHGQNLEGQPNWRSRDAEGYLPAPPHDKSGHTWHHADELLFKLTKLGTASIAGPDYKTRMPAYADVLRDEEIVAVLSYIKSRWPNRIRKRHDRLNEAVKGR
jgi:mono/diheme cytochrome c family protein